MKLYKIIKDFERPESFKVSRKDILLVLCKLFDPENLQ